MGRSGLAARGLLLLAMLLLLTPFLLLSAEAKKQQAAIGEEDEESYSVGASSVSAAKTVPSKQQTKGRVQIQDEDELDSDEFVGVPVKTKTKAADAGGKGTSASKAAASAAAATLPYDWTPAIVALPALLAILLTFLWGRRLNSEVAKNWALANRKTLFENFSHVGEGAILVKEASHLFRVSATGRINTPGLLAYLETKKRQDLLSFLLASFGQVYVNYDQITIDLPFNETALEPLVFAIVRTRAEKQFRKDNKDVAELCTVVKRGTLPASLVVLADEEEVADYLLTPPVVETLAKLERLLLCIYVTDQNNASPAPYRKLLRCVFKVENPAQETVQLELAFHLLDRLAEFRLPRTALQRAEKRRLKLLEAQSKASAKERDEAAAKAKAERKRKELEELQKGSPEALRRYEEKEARKASKRAMAARYKTI